MISHFIRWAGLLPALSLALFVLSSCHKTTADYAAKENGKTFGTWKITYTDIDGGVYWPDLVMEPVKGRVTEIKSLFVSKGWTYIWVPQAPREMDAFFNIEAITARDRHNAGLSEMVNISVRDEKNGWKTANHDFVFSVGTDTVRFSGEPGYGGQVLQKGGTADEILSLLSGRDSVNILVTVNDPGYGENYKTEREYVFKVPGSQELVSAIKLLKQRFELAEEESRKQGAMDINSLLELSTKLDSW